MVVSIARNARAVLAVTTITTLVQASARPMTVSGDYSRCSSKGTLEQRIVDVVKARLAR